MGSGVILGILLRSWVAGVSCCLVGILVDADHYLDFWLNRGFSLNLKRLMDFCYHGTSTKFYDILHGYEYIPFYVWIATIPGHRDLGIGLVVGYTLHLVGDQFYNSHLHRWTYFLTFRIWHRFESSEIVLYNPFVEPH